MGTQLPLPKNRGHSPQFSTHVCCGQTAGWTKMSLGTEVGLGPGDILLRGDTAPLPKNRGHSPQFSTHVCCGQTAGWTKMSLGMEVDLGSGHTVLYATLCSMWTQLPPEKKAHPPHPIFGPCLLWPNGWMDQDAAWYGS